jgi:hypothetical protein
MFSGGVMIFSESVKDSFWTEYYLIVSWYVNAAHGSHLDR